MMANVVSLIDELQRRNVFRAAVAYFALLWGVAEFTSLMIPALKLPESLLSIVVWVGLVAFPFVLVFAWVYEITPEGIKRTHEVHPGDSITGVTGRRLDYIAIGFVVVAIGLLALNRFAASDATGTEENVAGETGPPAPPAAAAPDTNSIAVLPFVNMSSDKEQEYFSDGISEELLNLLAKIPELKVIARTSSFSFKGKEADIAEIAAKLNVAHVLEGSVRKGGDTIRITAQLIRAADSVHLWSETYDRPLDNIFAVQDEISAAVVEQLKLKILGTAPSARPVDARVYPLLLQANALLDQGSAASNARAVALYQQALSINPGEARVWSALGRAYAQQAVTGLRPEAEAGRLAAEAYDKSLALDPDDPMTLARRAFVRVRWEGDLAGAAPYLERALALGPNNPGVVGEVGSYFSWLGRFDEAIAFHGYRVSRDPANPTARINLGAVLYQGRQYAEANKQLRMVQALAPGRAQIHTYLGYTLLYDGAAKAALEEFELEPDDAPRLLGLAQARHTLGDAKASDAALDAVIANHAQDNAANIAMACAWRGERDRAFDWLDKGVASGELVASYILDPGFGPLHDDPRWLPFLRSLGRAPEQLAAIKLEVKLPK